MGIHYSAHDPSRVLPLTALVQPHPSICLCPRVCPVQSRVLAALSLSTAHVHGDGVLCVWHAEMLDSVPEALPCARPMVSELKPRPVPPPLQVTQGQGLKEPGPMFRRLILSMNEMEVQVCFKTQGFGARISTV